MRMCDIGLDCSQMDMVHFSLHVLRPDFRVCQGLIGGVWRTRLAVVTGSTRDVFRSRSL